MSGPETPKVHGFCDAPVEMQIGANRITACCDLPRGHVGQHQALLEDPQPLTWPNPPSKEAP